RSLKGTKALTFEESTLSQWLYILLKDEVDELVVANPVAIAKSSAAKNDFLDATELADLLRVGRLKSVFHRPTSGWSCGRLYPFPKFLKVRE
ncbi:MAG TPA: hypothetical protein VM425_15375, partial [Myxococcota bacterium]|nr:hypothetical protein [Myxococcota bacterium]